MNFFSYLIVEVNRIFHSRTVYAIILLTIISPLVGYNLNGNIFNDILAESVSVDLIAKPCAAGAIVGGVLFAILTLLEFDRMRKHQVGALMNSVVSPLVLNLVRLVAIGTAAIVSVTLVSILYFPYVVFKMGIIFDSYTYWNGFFLLMLPSLLFSILSASAFYQIFSRMDLSMVVFIVFTLLSFLVGPYANILAWINPSIPALSDNFSNDMVFRLMQHNRLFWSLLLGGLWLVALLSVRRYGKGFFGSILYNSRKIYIPIIAVILIFGGYYAYINQPYIDRTKLELRAKISELKDNNQLKLSNTDLEISFNAHKGTLLGKAIYSIENISGNTQECVFGINSGCFYFLSLFKTREKGTSLN